ncbi:hypothetical protein CPB84DRAFT_1829888 [Gymnopilus junonius]|uniref:Uncharacterized protein n=1 Tax=Gymnopilus junonius TaxID=109634 RepID=A0A9P5TGJ2_GYMJU|nr:hypothetical protein CPB84DRAFT_1829888 [Gymnopilus junonius]
MSHSFFTPDEISQFRQFAALIIRGEPIPPSAGAPLGYVDFCILNQHNPDPSMRLPLPPGVSTQTVFVNGRETLALIPDQVAPISGGRINPAPATGSSSGVPAPVPEPSQQKRRRVRPKKNWQLKRFESAILERFDLDTEREKLSMRGVHSPSSGRGGHFAPPIHRGTPYSRPRFGNRTLDNRHDHEADHAFVPCPVQPSSSFHPVNRDQRTSTAGSASNPVDLTSSTVNHAFSAEAPAFDKDVSMEPAPQSMTAASSPSLETRMEWVVCASILEHNGRSSK